MLTTLQKIYDRSRRLFGSDNNNPYQTIDESLFGLPHVSENTCYLTLNLTSIKAIPPKYIPSNVRVIIIRLKHARDDIFDYESVKNAFTSPERIEALMWICPWVSRDDTCMISDSRFLVHGIERVILTGDCDPHTFLISRISFETFPCSLRTLEVEVASNNVPDFSNSCLEHLSFHMMINKTNENIMIPVINLPSSLITFTLHLKIADTSNSKIFFHPRLNVSSTVSKLRYVKTKVIILLSRPDHKLLIAPNTFPTNVESISIHSSCGIIFQSHSLPPKLFGLELTSNNQDIQTEADVFPETFSSLLINKTSEIIVQPDSFRKKTLHNLQINIVSVKTVESFGLKKINKLTVTTLLLDENSTETSLYPTLKVGLLTVSASRKTRTQNMLDMLMTMYYHGTMLIFNESKNIISDRWKVSRWNIQNEVINISDIFTRHFMLRPGEQDENPMSPDMIHVTYGSGISAVTYDIQTIVRKMSDFIIPTNHHKMFIITGKKKSFSVRFSDETGEDSVGCCGDISILSEFLASIPNKITSVYLSSSSKYVPHNLFDNMNDVIELSIDMKHLLTVPLRLDEQDNGQHVIPTIASDREFIELPPNLHIISIRHMTKHMRCYYFSLLNHIKKYPIEKVKIETNCLFANTLIITPRTIEINGSHGTNPLNLPQTIERITNEVNTVIYVQGEPILASFFNRYRMNVMKLIVIIETRYAECVNTMSPDLILSIAVKYLKSMDKNMSDVIFDIN
jgi:hypothetical protein